VNRQDWLAQEFERQRPHLRGVAYRMLGSISEAEDAVQEAWVRLDRRDPGGRDDLRGWLTVVVGRICLDMLRSRRSRRVDYAGSWLPEPIVTGAAEDSPEHDAVLADSVGLALLVVLETLSPLLTKGPVPTGDGSSKAAGWATSFQWCSATIACSPT